MKRALFSIGVTDKRCHQLGTGEIVSLETMCQGGLIECRQGLLWITQTGMERDIVLEQGQTFTPQPRGRLVIQALEAAAFLTRCHCRNN